MYSRGVFAKGMAASFGVVALILMLVVSSGAAFAMPIAGIGGFTIKADRIEGDDLHQYIGVSDMSNRAGAPVAVAEFTQIEIEGLELSKEFEGLPGIGGNARVVITSTGTVKADSLLIKQSKINAEESRFSGLLIDEENSDDATEQFKQVAPSTRAERTEGVDAGTTGKTIDLNNGENPGQVFENATIQAHYQATNSISIPGLTLTTEYDANGDGDYTDDKDIILN